MVETRAPEIVIGNLVPFIAGSIVFAFRVYTRAFLVRLWSLDDWLLLSGWLTAFALCVGATLETHYGAGMHEADIALSALIPNFKLSFGTLILYQLTLCLTKLSLVVLYLRVFNTTRSSRWFLYGVFLFTVMFTFAGEIVAIFQCKPIQGFWDYTIKSKCIDLIPAFYSSAICNQLVDVLLISFAVPQILALQLAKRQRDALLVTVALGCVPLIASIVRVVRVSYVLHATDRSWASYDSSIWSSVEVNVSVLCVSAPVTKPLLRQLVPRIFGTTTATRYGAHSDRNYNNGSRPGNTSGSGNGVVTGNARTTWMTASNKSKNTAFGTVSEVHHGIYSSDADNSSAIELAAHAARSGKSDLDISGDDDDYDTDERQQQQQQQRQQQQQHGRITKSTRVTVHRS